MKMIGAKNASVRARVCKGSPLVRRRTPNTRYVAPQKKKNWERKEDEKKKEETLRGVSKILQAQNFCQ